MTSPDTPPRSPGISLTFHGDTRDLLRNLPGRDRTIVYPLSRRASIKDIVEGLGIPHTEIGRLVAGGLEQTFATIPADGEHFEIHPLSPALPPTMATVLRPEPLAGIKFLVDINVGRLTGLLRMAGCDTEAVGKNKGDKEIVLTTLREGRILLTRNRDLLKRRELVFGRLVRNQSPHLQLEEIVSLYHLQDHLLPFSRCISCNGLLAPVEKGRIIDQLLPLTQKYFHRFRQCQGCGKIYWQGSHYGKMLNILKRTVLARKP